MIDSPMRCLVANVSYLYSLLFGIPHLQATALNFWYFKRIWIANAPGMGARIKNLHRFMYTPATNLLASTAKGSHLQLVHAWACIAHHLLQCGEFWSLQQGWEFIPNPHHRIACAELMMMNLMETLPTDNAWIHLQNCLQVQRSWFKRDLAPLICRHIIDTNLEDFCNIRTSRSAGSPDSEYSNPLCRKSCIHLLKLVGENGKPPLFVETLKPDNILERQPDKDILQ